MAKSDGSIQHFNAVRLSVNGSGNLRMRLLSLDEVIERVLTPLVMATLTSKELTVLTNFTQQRAQLEIKTIDMDEIFSISQIVIFSKPIASSYPG